MAYHNLKQVGTSEARYSYPSKGSCKVRHSMGDSTYGGVQVNVSFYSDGDSKHKASYSIKYKAGRHLYFAKDLKKGNGSGSGSTQFLTSSLTNRCEPSYESSCGYWAQQNNHKPRRIIVKYTHYAIAEPYLEFDTSKGQVQTPKIYCSYMKDPTFAGMTGCILMLDEKPFVHPNYTDASGVWKVNQAKLVKFGLDATANTAGICYIIAPAKINRTVRVYCSTSARNKLDITYKFFTLFTDFRDDGNTFEDTKILSHPLNTESMSDGDKLDIYIPDIEVTLNGKLLSSHKVTISKSDVFCLVVPKPKPQTFIEFAIQLSGMELNWKLNGE